ncbi:Ig-like domain-containing protein [Dietzia cinnamea]|uniref:Ig-like domain-containing protein n=1 Tax=Dietzia cinnamea TaxID=321318 RepID=UPI00223A9C7E|nr:Ig-like domain-containing protein [Dietzia cinnamea]MCT1865444.1 Ig-like domain-containing protein [Dietzia cinnamea]MCT2107640.1 Ig-like domain-containing protein [Dietzia cinnamea]
MTSGIARRLAAAGTVMATGAALVVVTSATAQAAPVSATGGSEQMKFTRTVSQGVVTHGDRVTLTNTIERNSTNAWMLTWFRDQHPTCLDLVPGTVSWTVGGDTYTQVSNPSEVEVQDDALVVDNPLVSLWNPPLTVTADYTVNCAAGQLRTGGVEWNRTQWNVLAPLNEEFLNAGPTITVNRVQTALALAPVVGARVGTPVEVTATATNIPDGQRVTFHDGGTQIGEAQVSGGAATIQWTPTVTGTHAIEARFAQTGTHAGAVSTQNVSVGTPNVSSTTTVAPVPAAQVGRGATLTAVVSPLGAGGTIEFRVDGVAVATAPGGADGRANYLWVPERVGDHTVTAVFSGRDGVLGSEGSRTVAVAAQEPGAVASSTTVDEVAPGIVGDEMTLRARVSPARAGGTVTFLDGDVVIGTATVGADGVATLRWTPATAGQRVVTAQFAGTSALLASEGTGSVVVNPKPDAPSGSLDLGSLGSSGGGSATGS